MFEFTSAPSREKDFELSKGMRKVIDFAIMQTSCYNRSELMYTICDVLSNKYGGDRLDAQLAKMGVSTTNDIKQAIDTYFALNFKDGKMYVRADKINGVYKDFASAINKPLAVAAAG